MFQLIMIAILKENADIKGQKLSRYRPGQALGVPGG
jgi:hypothetical protein